MNFYNFAQHAQSVTPGSGLLTAESLIYVGKKGSLKVVPAIGAASSVTFPAVNSGTVLPLGVLKVLSGTTASGLVAIW